MGKRNEYDGWGGKRGAVGNGWRRWGSEWRVKGKE